MLRQELGLARLLSQHTCDGCYDAPSVADNQVIKRKLIIKTSMDGMQAIPASVSNPPMQHR
jgi:hypothetical protein